jgi:hypothetical protein
MRSRPRSSRGHVIQPKRTLPSWLIVVLAIIGIAAVVFIGRELFSLLTEDEATASSDHNRTWLNLQWTHNPPQQDDIKRLADTLNRNQIDTVYVWGGDWRTDAEQNGLIYRARPYTQEFRSALKEADPDIRVLAWVWVNEEHYPFEEPRVQLVNFARQAVQDWDYDGIHLQGFGVVDESPGFIALIRSLDEVLDDNHTLSITVPPDHQPTDPEVPSSSANRSPSWSLSYKERLAFIVDEMVIMAHASGLDSREDYEKWLAYQVETYARIIELNDFDTDLIAVLPAYIENAQGLHDPNIENISSALDGILQALDDSSSARNHISGVGIYRYEDVSNEDWDRFSDKWLDR